jgi:hypothetical protein
MHCVMEEAQRWTAGANNCGDGDGVETTNRSSNFYRTIREL